MNIFKLLDLYDVKPEALDTFTSRRNAFMKLANFGKKTAMAAIPITLGTSMVNTATAKTSDHLSFVDVLNFALTLEYLEADYYTMGLKSGIIPAEDLPIFELFEKHEILHVEFLTAVINSLGGTPVPRPTFDFTAGGAFNPFGSYDQFKALSQAFEDTGVRAYKGQAANLMDNNELLTAALQIHSVEARHASEVRRLRGIKGWITQDNRGAGMPEATQPVYDGEDQVVQAGVDVRNVTSVGEDGITESFDEPLTMAEVLAIGGLFIVS